MEIRAGIVFIARPTGQKHDPAGNGPEPDGRICSDLRGTKEELRSIWLYTCELWSMEQADANASDIYNRCVWLAEQPSVGKHRPDDRRWLLLLSARPTFDLLPDPGRTFLFGGPINSDKRD